jgi:hypothetical protein
MLTGDRILALAFGLFGVVWIVEARKLAYWSDFAPGSGFLPYWLGVVIVALAVFQLVQSFRAPAAAAAGEGAPRRTARVGLIVGGLFLCLAALPWVGFPVAIAAYLAYLVGFVERRPIGDVLLVAFGASLALWLIFKVWLRVPLPVGPWGF